MRRINNENSRALWGLTQLETAMILGIPRSQWSHYESGTRSLPEGGSTRVSEMITHMVSPEGAALKSLEKPEYQESATKVKIEKRLRENEYQLMVITSKITKVSEKLEKYSKGVEVLDFLNSPEEIGKYKTSGLSAVTPIVIINYKRSKSQLILLQVDEELLQQEKLILEATLKRLSETAD